MTLPAAPGVREMPLPPLTAHVPAPVPCKRCGAMPEIIAQAGNPGVFVVCPIRDRALFADRSRASAVARWNRMQGERG